MLFKKLNTRLLEDYPLLWNMRLPGILGVLVLFHIVHFCTGYGLYTGVEDMGWESPTGMYFSTSFSLFSIIGSCVIFILWLNRVFRNNAFKSFYPVSNTQLYGQFCIILLVCFLNISGYYSFTSGYVAHARNNTSNSANEKDIELYNRVICFLQNKEDYRIDNRCSPYPFPLTKKYVSDVAIRNGKDSPDDYYYVSRDGQAYSSRQVDSIAGGQQYAYLNFCNNYAVIVPEQGFRYASQNRYEQGLAEYSPHVLLRDPQKLKADMKAFLALCARNKVGYKLDADDWFNWVNNPPYYPVRYTIYQKYYAPSRYASAGPDLTAETALQLNPKGYFVEVQKLRSILQHTQKAHEYSYESGPLLGMLYAALSIALLIFSFRATSRRIWMISLVGSALLGLVIGAFTAVLAFGGGKEGILYFYLLIIAAFLVIHLISTGKTISGVALNWFTWFLPLVSTIILGLTESKNYQHTTINGVQQWTDPWIFDHLELYFLICLLIYLLTLCFVLVPRYRKWQAMPEN
ncbi:MAG TPA: sulfite exporter TauE/SafE family protein [Chitinophagaceae bacterium]|nr:sulfite exporter TauE/SafE family protein [Chitinophagaceae bacterium]